MFWSSAEKQLSIFFEFFNRIGRSRSLNSRFLASAYGKKDSRMKIIVFCNRLEADLIENRNLRGQVPDFPVR